jgi:hypothetical protein
MDGVYFRDPLPYIPGTYHKTPTFVIENNVSPQLRLGIFWYLKKMVSEIKRVPYGNVWIRLSETYIHCRAVGFVVNCWIRYSDLCCRLCKIFCFGKSVLPGTYHKTPTFVIENNVSPLRYLINIVTQQNQVS